jgi:hypothetical protein
VSSTAIIKRDGLLVGHLTITHEGHVRNLMLLKGLIRPKSNKALAPLRPTVLRGAPARLTVEFADGRTITKFWEVSLREPTLMLIGDDND